MSDTLSYLSNADSVYVDQLYQEYLANPESVDFGWRKFFEGFQFGKTDYTGASAPDENVLKEIKVLNLIHGYRDRGHLFTHTNPVRERRKYTPTLDIENFGLANADLETVFQAGTEVGIGPAKLKDIISHLKATYCESIGVEFMYMRSPELVEWIRKRMESSRGRRTFSIEERKHILHKLNQATAFENFLHTKFVGQKRFSLEGCEALIPALDAIIERGADKGAKEFIIGMAHRGRLNVLANILNKPYDDIFREFEGYVQGDNQYLGDVKYHQGHSFDVKTEKGETVHLALCPNPSHLEAVDPVAQGVTRAKQDLKYAGDEDKCVTISIHGDAAIAGQGVVYEVVQMSELEAYRIGGTIHVVTNNQVGFTTNFHDARSSTYCTDVAKVTLSPVFHVNADDIEAVVFACELAMDFRQEFNKDVYIDLLGYRKYGHNEGDEPRFTQPLLYKAIEAHPNPREIYFQKLVAMGGVEASLAKEMEQSFKKMLQDRLDMVKAERKAVEYSYLQSRWAKLRSSKPSDWVKSVETGFAAKRLKEIALEMASLPADKKFFNKSVKLFEDRRKMVESDKLDWAMGELLAYATLLEEGFNVRISGQDVERGTFAHRHAVVTMEDVEEQYVPLRHVKGGQGRFDIFNSHLSEYAVLGFEYGYSTAAPLTLNIWEAQFGDFSNGAQIIIDQFISSSETKWKRMSGLTLMLPHGYEGQGPEHSSARMERYLELCAGYNMQVVNITTPANYFHLLRRQLHRDFRTPLVIMTPKSLLRHPLCVSGLAEMSNGRFQEVIDDAAVKAVEVKRVLFCTGKVYYDLVQHQEKEGRKDVAIVRLEQVNPVPFEQLDAIFRKYRACKEWYWVQEEPENNGAWPFLLRKLRDRNLTVVSRPESSSPATGYSKVHAAQQADILARAFAPVTPLKSTKKVLVKS